MIVRRLVDWLLRSRNDKEELMSIPDYTVRHNTEASRFEAEINGLLCIAEYRLRGNVVDMHHTVVPPALEGHGIAARLVSTALDWVRAQGYKLRPSCSYVRLYVQRHPQVQDLLA